MLVLTRKHQEKIRIGDHITITVLKTKGKTVRLGIEAPAEVPVIRGELSFDGREVQWQEEPELVEAPAVRSATGDHKHLDRVQSRWPAKANVLAATSTPPGDLSACVSLQRVPRAELGQIPPNALNGVSPLRAILNRRSMTS